MLFGDVIIEGNDRRQGYLNMGCPNGDIGVYIDHGDTALENRLDGILPRPKTQWHITQWQIICVQYQRGTTVQLSQKVLLLSDLIIAFVCNALGAVTVSMDDSALSRSWTNW